MLKGSKKVLNLILLVFTVFFVMQASAFGAVKLLDYSKEILFVKDTLDKLEVFNTTLQNAKIAYSKNNEVDFRTYSDSNGSLKSRLEAAASAANKINIPTDTSFTLGNMPDLVPLLDQEISVRHESFVGVLSSLQKGKANIDSLEKLKSKLEENLSILEANEKTLVVLAQAFLEAAKVNPLPELKPLFELNWFDIEVSLKPAVAKVKNVYKSKIKEVTNALEEHRKGYRNFTHNMETYLALDREAIEQEIRKLTDNQGSIQEQMEKYQHENNRLKKEQDRLVAIQKALVLDSQNLESRQGDFSRKVESFNSSLSSLNKLEKKIKRDKYSFCPNKKTFDNCNHNEEKKRWVDRHNGWISKYNRKAKDIEKKSKSLDSIKKSIEQDIATYNKEGNKFQSAQKKFEKEIKLWEEQGDVLSDKFAKAWELNSAKSNNENLLSQLLALKE